MCSVLQVDTKVGLFCHWGLVKLLSTCWVFSIHSSPRKKGKDHTSNKSRGRTGVSGAQNGVGSRKRPNRVRLEPVLWRVSWAKPESTLTSLFLTSYTEAIIKSCWLKYITGIWPFLTTSVTTILALGPNHYQILPSFLQELPSAFAYLQSTLGKAERETESLLTQ